MILQGSVDEKRLSTGWLFHSGLKCPASGPASDFHAICLGCLDPRLLRFLVRVRAVLTFSHLCFSGIKSKRVWDREQLSMIFYIT